MSKIDTTLLSSPGVLPFLPMLYVAWSDGLLTPTEIDSIRDRIQKQKWLTKEEKKLLRNWLDPASPPQVGDLLTIYKTIRQSAKGLSRASRKSLVELGLGIARIGASDDYERCTSPEACKALEEIEAALGVVGQEAVEQIMPEAPEHKEADEPKPVFDVPDMTRLLDGDYAEIRDKIRKLMSDQEFAHRYGLDRSTYREQALTWCRRLAEQGLGALSFPRACGGAEDLGAFIAAFETLAFHDLSLVIKFGVQFGLFGGSIHNLGTDRHHSYLRAAGSLELPGCFAMTELGHGSNVRDIETTAVYEPDSREFVIHTPTESARKDYIGNAALHGRMATVFAQLQVNGEDYGVHAFLVPIRDDKGKAMAGVRIEDCGEKLGLNGVDNGRLWFDQVRIPRENLLNRFAEVSEDGIYTSSIASASQRFFTMLGTLVGGRISVAGAALSAAKSALTIAIRYATVRRQFGAPAEPETLLLDYPIHQRRLLPLLATAYALNFAQAYLVRRYVKRNEDDSREVEVLAAGIKSIATWNATSTIQACREACGGQGYLAVNRFAALKADTDVFTTFEGDNTVLMQLVAKGCLTQFRYQFQEMKLIGLVKFLASQVTTGLAELNPVVTRLTDETHLRSADFHRAAFEYREQRLLVTAGRRLKARIDEGVDSFSAFTDCQHHLIQLAHAYVEQVIHRQFLAAIESCGDERVAAVLTQLAQLYALSRIESDRGWFLENGFIEGRKAKAIRFQVDRLCSEVRPQARYLVDAFAIPDASLAAPIALSDT